jgi:ribosomal protein S18 acetylase RimI-like enzyme
MSSPVTVQVSFRDMRNDDIETGLRLCRASGWNQTRSDWELFLKFSPQGCRVAVKDARVIGTVATLRYQDRFSWISMMLVDPAEAGQGIGGLLMSQALDVLKDMPSIRLDATPVGYKLYSKLNFIEEYRLSRMETLVSSEGLMIRPNPARSMTKEDLPAVETLDREVFGADRRVMLEWMFTSAPEYATVIEQQGQIIGYTFGRHGFNFEHLGPVIARDQETARLLVSSCLFGQTGKPFIIDASHHETDWSAWLESIGFHEQRPFTRMFYRDNPHPGLPAKQFGIMGPEFG